VGEDDVVTAVVVIEAVVIALLLVLVAGLLKSHAEILRQLHRLEETSGPGRPQTGIEFETAPISQIAGVDPHGTPRVIDLSNGRGNTVLAFLSSGCASCHAFWERLARDHDLSIPDARLVVVTRGAASESPSRIAELAPIDVPVIMSDDAWDRFRVPMTPFFLMIDPDIRVVGEGSAAGWKQLLRLLRQSIADSQHPARMDTVGRERFTDDNLGRSGVTPDDPSLHENPLEA
jgi:hypothetical protein